MSLPSFAILSIKGSISIPEVNQDNFPKGHGAKTVWVILTNQQKNCFVTFIRLGIIIVDVQAKDSPPCVGQKKSTQECQCFCYF